MKFETNKYPLPPTTKRFRTLNSPCCNLPVISLWENVPELSLHGLLSMVSSQPWGLLVRGTTQNISSWQPEHKTKAGLIKWSSWQRGLDIRGNVPPRVSTSWLTSQLCLRLTRCEAASYYRSSWSLLKGCRTLSWPQSEYPESSPCLLLSCVSLCVCICPHMPLPDYPPSLGWSPRSCCDTPDEHKQKQNN